MTACGGSSNSIASWSIPSTPLSGVRISCDIDAMNLPFASDAARAFAAVICRGEGMEEVRLMSRWWRLEVEVVVVAWQPVIPAPSRYPSCR